VIVNPMGSAAIIGNGGPESAFTVELLVPDAGRTRSLLKAPPGRLLDTGPWPNRWA